MDKDLFIELQDALLNALPYVEDVIDDPGFKKGVVKRHAKAIREAIAKLDERLKAS